jgi:hypothetical protein
MSGVPILSGMANAVDPLRACLPSTAAAGGRFRGGTGEPRSAFFAMTEGPMATAKGERSRWSAEVTEHSDALDLEAGVFKLRSASAIARSLKHSAERSRRRKSSPYRSAMSMLTFYVNRAGKNLTPAQRRRLDAAKVELRKLFGKEEE